MRLQNKYWLLLAAGGMLLSSSASAEDDSAEGVVRLGRSPQTASLSAVADSGMARQASFSLGHGGSCESCNACNACNDGCMSGACEWGSGCPSGCGYGSCGWGQCGSCGQCGGCGYGGCHSCALLNYLRSYAVGGCSFSPDHGWAPPGKHPRPRTAATYRNWFPTEWTGQGSYAQPGHRYPMVYTPTDTTQLGYYYQRVPVWQHRNGMIPPVPHPEAFHVPDFGCGRNGVCHNGMIGAGACGHQGEIISDDAVGDAPSAEHSVPAESAPQPASPQSAAPPSPETPPVPDSTDSAPPATAPEPPPAAAPPALEKSALAPFLYVIPAQ